MYKISIAFLAANQVKFCMAKKSCKKSHAVTAGLGTHACPERRTRISLLPTPFLSATSYLLWLKRGVRNLWQKMDVILSGALRINTMPCRYKLAYVIDHFSMIYCERKKFVQLLNLKRAAPSSKQIQQLFIVWKTVCPSLLFFLVKCTSTRICKETRRYTHLNHEILSEGNFLTFRLSDELLGSDVSGGVLEKIKKLSST